MEGAGQDNRRPLAWSSRARAIGMCVLVLCVLILLTGLPWPRDCRAAEPTAPPVLSACEIGYPPSSIVHEDGQVDGFSVELLRAALGKMGREVQFRTGSWDEVRGWLERGEVDALPLVGRTPERESLFDFTVPYMTTHGAIVVREETEDVRTLADLRGRRVGVMKGDNVEEFLRREDRGLEIVATVTFSEALYALAEGRCDAVVVQRPVAIRLLEETGLANLRIVDQPLQDFAQEFCFAVKQGDDEMLSVLNEGLALTMADGTHRRLHAKWFASLELPSDRPIVVGGDYSYPPFEFLDGTGRPTGFAVELTRAIARELNMNVQIELGPWEDMVTALRDGRIDVLEGMFYTSERDRELDFSPRYVVIRHVSLVRRGEGPPPTTFEDLAGRDLVVQAGDVILDALAEHGVTARITTVETQEDVVRAVAEGRNACGLATRYAALYAMGEHGWTNIEIGGRSFYSGDYCYAVLEGNEALLAEFTEGLQLLRDSGEYQRIYEKWLGAHEPGLSARTVLIYIGIAAGPLLLVALVALLWSWSLRRRVSARTRELTESLGRFQSVFEAANVGKSMTLPTGELNVNKAFAEMLGYAPDELRGRNWRELTPSADVPETERFLAPLLEGREDATRFEKRYLRKDGVMVWTDVSVSLLRDAQNRPLQFITTIVDITERKEAELRIERLNRLLRAVRDVNQLITHETDRDALLRRSCEVLVSTRGYHNAWVAIRDAEGRFQTVAQSGAGEGFAMVRESLERGEWPECDRLTMEHPGDIMLIRDSDEVCNTCALQPAYHDAAILAGRLRHAEGDYGVLAVSLSEELADDEEEQSLFWELVGDLAYALHSMDTAQARKQSEDALRESEEFVRAVLDNLPVGIAVNSVDPAVEFSYMNDSFPATYRTTRETLAGRDAFWEAVYEDPLFRESMRKKVLDDCASGDPKRMVWEDVPITREGEETAFVFAHNIPVPGKDLSISLVWDVTERKRAEQELRRHRDHLEEVVEERTAELKDLNLFISTVLNTAPAGIVTYRSDGECVSANGYAGRLIGTTREQVFGQNFRTIKSWRESGLVEAADMCLETGDPQHAEISTRTSYGKDVDLDVRFARFMSRGSAHLLLMFSDITDRVRAEEALKRYSVQLEATNRELEAFAYSVSHDLRAPLRSISGFSQALLEDYADKVDEEGREHLRRVQAGAQRMGQLIDDLLVLSRITRWKMEPSEVDMSALALGAIASLQQSEPGRQVGIVIEDGLVAQGDIRLLRVVLDNLLGNAWKFSSRTADARIEVGRARNAEIGMRHTQLPADAMVYFVRDNGVGFDMAYADKLFGAFQRLHSAAEFEGTGIGLATVQRAILRHGGRVWAEGEVSKGATFYFTLT